MGTMKFFSICDSCPLRGRYLTFSYFLGIQNFQCIQGQTAEFVTKYVDKGARVGVVGQLQVDMWNDKATGEARNRAKVIVRDFDILETRAEAELRRTGSRGPTFSTEDDNDDMYSSAGSGGFFNGR
jgi:single-stranded DNA-binding protein